MQTVPASMQSVILAVLQEAREAGVGRLTRTTLFKLVYLLDCLHAEVHDGTIASGSEWYFHHYGPYAVNLAGEIDRLASRGIVQSLAGEHKDKEFTQYWIGEHPIGPSLKDVGLVGTSSSRFGSLLRKYSKDLSQLLNYTYFKTLPMQGATPGQPLDFCVLKEAASTKMHQRTTIKDHAKILKLAHLAQRLTETYKRDEGSTRAMKAHRPIYDQAFATVMDSMDLEDDEQVSIPFTAQLA
jgi:hypothetical protein